MRAHHRAGGSLASARLQARVAAAASCHAAHAPTDVCLVNDPGDQIDVTYVQHQVGHAESRMTLDVYNQLLDRSKRDHGAAFDALAEARHTLYGPPARGLSHRLGHRAPRRPIRLRDDLENHSFAGTSRRARQDSNLRLPAPEASALSTELRALTR